MPERVQLSRKRGWRKPHNTVVVARPSRWGNPFKITQEPCDQMNENGMCWVVRYRTSFAHASTQEEARAEAVSEYATYLRAGLLTYGVEEVRAALAGKNLACWCPPSSACHADVLPEIANEPQ